MRVAIGALLLGACTPIAAHPVCHIVYGGEHFEVPVEPTADPYAVAARPIGRYFTFKAVYVPPTQTHAVLSLYVYGMASGEPVLIHQVKFIPPLVDQGAHGFTGFHSVYEPTKGSELQYWCAVHAHEP